MLRSLVGSEMCIRDRNNSSSNDANVTTTIPLEEELVISEPVADGVTGAPRAWIIRDPVENLTLIVFAGTYKPVSPTYLGVFKCSAQFARTWMANLRYSEAPLPEGAGVDAPGSGCHRGAVGIYNSLRKELHARIPEGDAVVTCGHGLGGCLLYTSDAADEEDSGDLGGRRIIKKKKMKK
eukprot:TRINITY_DN32720_c0_g1_i1.p1 TRINITY_DN32720_c0_g1~~TRINITY_DN32720_c0_g1_i1.p1  ORF type:complete len:180 (-),score=44.40 TRINITY_DN32720_c0_g1_i1:15-554(-)